MRKLFVILLALLLLLAVPVSAAGYLVVDIENLLTEEEAELLEARYAESESNYGITVALVTVDSFQGATAEDYANYHYSSMDYPPDGIQFLVSLGGGGVVCPHQR